jgi:hypothetical protein
MCGFGAAWAPEGYLLFHLATGFGISYFQKMEDATSVTIADSTSRTN